MKTDHKYPHGIYTIRVADTKTGTWRTVRPVVNPELCIACGICMMYCPVGVITEEDKLAQVNYDYCKGCGVCSTVCPKKAISMEKEGE